MPHLTVQYLYFIKPYIIQLFWKGTANQEVPEKDRELVSVY